MTAGSEQSLMSHLLELRQRLLHAVVAVLAVFMVLLPFANPLYAWLAEPLKQTLPPGSQLVAIEVASTFFVPMKLAFFAALFIAAPYILYQIWAFVAPALYERERIWHARCCWRRPCCSISAVPSPISPCCR